MTEAKTPENGLDIEKLLYQEVPNLIKEELKSSSPEKCLMIIRALKEIARFDLS